MFKFCASKKIADKFELVLCCVFSYVMNAVCELVYGRWPSFTVLSNIYGKVVISSICFTLICIFCAWVLQRSWFENVCVSWFHVSPRSDLLDGILDTPEAANIRIYLKSNKGSVYGHYAGRDDDSSDPWIAIKGPIIYSSDGIQQDFDKGVMYLVRLSEVDHMVVD